MSELKYDFDNLENIKRSIVEYTNVKNNKSNLILLKHSSELYSKNNAISLKILLEKDYRGIFVSFQRPLKNLIYWIGKNNLDKKNILFLDYSNKKNLEKLYEEILRSIKKIKGDKKFVFIDSLNTMALCNQDIWLDDFTKKILDEISKKKFGNTLFVVNVAKELSKKNIVNSFISYADGIIDTSNPKDSYSHDLTKNTVFT